VLSPSLPDSVVSGSCFFGGGAGGCMRLAHICLVLRPRFVLMLDRSSVFQREETHCIFGCDASELFHNGLDLLKVHANYLLWTSTKLEIPGVCVTKMRPYFFLLKQRDKVNK